MEEATMNQHIFTIWLYRRLSYEMICARMSYVSTLDGLWKPERDSTSLTQSCLHYARTIDLMGRIRPEDFERWVGAIYTPSLEGTARTRGYLQVCQEFQSAMHGTLKCSAQSP